MQGPAGLEGLKGLKGDAWQARFASASTLTAALVMLVDRPDVDIISVQSNRRGFEDYLHDLLDRTTDEQRQRANPGR